MSQARHPSRASKSATSSRNAQVAAARCPASSQIRASRCAIGISAGSSVPHGTPSVFDTGLAILEYLSISSILATGTDILAAPTTEGRARLEVMKIVFARNMIGLHHLVVPSATDLLRSRQPTVVAMGVTPVAGLDPL